MQQGTTVVARAGLVAVVLFALSCTESVGPERRAPYTPSFSFAASGITLNRQAGVLGGSGQLLIKGFNPTNPHHGDAIVATFFWLGSTNIIDSVRDVLTTAPSYTPVGNTYHLVEYVTAGGYSMATYVATNVQNFPDPNTDPNQGDILAVAGYLSQPVSDGGVALSTWTGVEDNFTIALGAHRSSSGSGSTITTAQSGPIAINAGALALTVTMSGLYGLDRPQSFSSAGPGTDNSIKEEVAYATQSAAGTVDPAWTWFYGSPATWLVTTFALNAAGSPTGDLTAATSTSGQNLDPDGYAVTVDGGTSQAIADNGSVNFTGLTPGSHGVDLSGVAANCTVSGGTSRTVDVTAGGNVSTSFSVSCTAPGNLSVTTSTTGLSQDLNGYTVTVDGGQSSAIATNGSVTLTGLTPTSHSVALSGVAVNCTVAGSNPRDVIVPSGGTIATSFTVSCVPGPATRLVYTVQPSNSAPYASISPAVKVKALDAQNNTVTTYTGPVSIAISVNGGLLAPGTLSGTKTVTPVNGVATFSNLSIDQKGDGYKLRASSGSLTGVTSASFNIVLLACLGPLCL